MNKYNIMTENIFRSEENILWLKKQLMAKFGYRNKNDLPKLAKPNRMAFNFINENVDRLVGDYDLSQLLTYSTPIGEPDPYRQAQCINSQFLQDRVEFIKQNIIDLQSGAYGQWYDRKPYKTVTLTDHLPVSGKTTYFGFGSTEGSNPKGIITVDNYKQYTPMGVINPSLDPVGTWNMMASGPLQARDDIHGKEGAENSMVAGAHYKSPLQKSSFAYSYEYNDDANGGDGVYTNPDGLDESVNPTGNEAAASSNHYNELVNNSMYKIMNNEKLWTGDNEATTTINSGNTGSSLTSFDPDDRSDLAVEELLYNIGQGYVRNSDISNRDKPRFYEVPIGRRHYNRDVDEVLSGAEFENVNENGRAMSRDFDMTSYRCRVNQNSSVCYDDLRADSNKFRTTPDPYKPHLSFRAGLDFSPKQNVKTNVAKTGRATARK